MNLQGGHFECPTRSEQRLDYTYMNDSPLNRYHNVQSQVTSMGRVGGGKKEETSKVCYPVFGTVKHRSELTT
jgi:hypothetical protein